MINYIPREVDCTSRTVNRCDWYNVNDCKHTCNFAEEKDYLGIGSMTVEDLGRLEKEINNGKK